MTSDDKDRCPVEKTGGEITEIKYLHTEEVAPMFRCTPQTIRVWCKEGKFPGYIRVGLKYLIPEDTVRAVVRDTYDDTGAL